jgi:trans-aconitate methyltransferase
MSVLESTFMRMFGRPTGMLGKLGGIIMARVNAPFARCVIRLLDVQPRDKVLEIGFGPGVGIQLLAKSAPEGRVAGVDCSREMVEQASARNADIDHVLTDHPQDLQLVCGAGVTLLPQ